MKIRSILNQKLPSILISAVIGILFALIIGTSALNILAYGLPKQLFFLALLSFGLGALCYFVLTRVPARAKTLLSQSDTELSAFIRKVFLAFFFLFPLTLILYQQIIEFLQILGTGQSSDFIGWLPPGNSRAFFIQVFALSCVFLAVVFLAGKRPSVRRFFNNLPDLWYVLFIFAFSLMIRLPIIHSINTQPISDFGIINEDALALAQGERPTHMYVATHVAVTMVYSFIYRIFGSDLNVIKIFHAAIYGLAGFFLYSAGKMVFGSKLWAVVASVLLVGLPSLAFYSNVLTPEHMFILIACVLVFVIAYLFKNYEEDKVKTAEKRTTAYLPWSLIIGFLIGLAGMFRPFGELFLAAFIFTLFLYIKNLKVIAINLLCVLIAFWLVRNIPAKIATHYQNQFGNIRPCNLLVGMNFDAAGQYNAEDVELCSQLRSKIPNETLFTKTVMGIVWERFQEQQKEFIPFVDEKFAILWTNSNGILYWTVQQVNGGDPNSILEAVRKVNLIDFAIVFLITIICIIGTVLAFFKDVKPVLFFCLLTFFGFNMMEIPFELQTRYRTVVMPLIIFFACWTLAAISVPITNHDHESKMWSFRQ